MSGIREVIVFLENNLKSKVTDIVKAVGMPIRAVQSHLTYLQELGCLIKTGCKTRYRLCAGYRRIRRLVIHVAECLE